MLVMNVVDFMYSVEVFLCVFTIVVDKTLLELIFSTKLDVEIAVELANVVIITSDFVDSISVDVVNETLVDALLLCTLMVVVIKVDKVGVVDAKV